MAALSGDARNYFIFSSFTIGMSWIDLANLKIENIAGGRIYYKRSKTGKEHTIKINNKISDIIDYYSKGKKWNDYLFPIIQRTANPEDMRKDIKNNLKNYNKQLKKIAEMAD
ncbi:MAG: hypothetical protein RQ866_09055, partial [Bacteroidales bacterium]|nr:hypothetical protein [Bacteroidales bacterium]